MKNIQTIQDVFQDLLQRIRRNDDIKTVSEEFSKINSNSERVLFAYNIFKKYELFPELIVDEKNDEVAVQLREEGNKKFKEKKLQQAVDLYTQSLALAQLTSDNFSKALANRSAALLELGLYEECLIDIEASLENNYPQDLQLKLIKRRDNATFQIKSSKEKLNYFKKIPEIPKDSKSTSIQCASNALEIKISETQGRHVVAKENIKLGDIVAVEKPFCHILSSEFFSHCHECLKLCYNLLPCPNCTQVLYCNLECQKRAATYHKYECKILKTLRSLQLDKMKLLPLKIALSVKDSYNLISQSPALGMNDIYRSDRYQEIHNLVANTDSRKVADLFERSATAAAVFNLIKTHGSFFNQEKDEAIFRELVLLHFQTAPCNFHEISELHKTEDGYFDAQEIGAGAFSFLSLFNHGCNPNVVRHCYGNIVVLRAIKSIRKGEQCYDNYGYHFALMPKIDRQNNLKKQYFFECTCDTCENDWPLLHNLPSTKFDTGVTGEDISNLRKGDGACAEKISQRLLPQMEELEKMEPSRLFCEMQEVLKQCYALFGNVGRI